MFSSFSLTKRESAVRCKTIKSSREMAFIFVSLFFSRLAVMWRCNIQQMNSKYQYQNSTVFLWCVTVMAVSKIHHTFAKMELFFFSLSSRSARVSIYFVLLLHAYPIHFNVQINCVIFRIVLIVAVHHLILIIFFSFCSLSFYSLTWSGARLPLLTQ